MATEEKVAPTAGGATAELPWQPLVYERVFRQMLQTLNYRRCESTWEGLWDRYQVRTMRVVWSAAWMRFEGPDTGLPILTAGAYAVAYHPDGLSFVPSTDGKTSGGPTTVIPLRSLPGPWRRVYSALRERDIVYHWPLLDALTDVDPNGLVWYHRLRDAATDRERDELLIWYGYWNGILPTEPEYLIQLVRLHHALGLGRQYDQLLWLM